MSSDSFTIVRDYDAPRELVFAAWTDPEQLAVWWVPGPGFHVPLASVDVDARAGGHLHLDMVEEANGETHPVRATFDAFEAPDLLVLRHAANPGAGMPREASVRVELTGATRLTLRSGPYEEPLRPFAEQGWQGCLDNLEHLLAEPRLHVP